MTITNVSGTTDSLMLRVWNDNNNEINIKFHTYDGYSRSRRRRRHHRRRSRSNRFRARCTDGSAGATRPRGGRRRA